jgi:DNA primase
MANSRVDEWETDTEIYSESQVEAVLDAIGVEIVSDTETHFLCLCPFHGNTDTPAFAVSKTQGLYICFNPSCEVSGRLVDLVVGLQHINALRAELFIAKRKNSSAVYERKEAVNPTKFEEWSQAKLDELSENFWNTPVAVDYMHGRGFEDETLRYFGVGFSPSTTSSSGKVRQAMVTVPMHDFKGMPIGLVGRSLVGKEFKNSLHLPKKYTCWNVHRARKASGTVIIVESTFDAMRLHQAGYPNVIALLGGSFSDYHADQINRYFNTVVIMTDFEQKEEDIINYGAGCRKCGGRCRGHRPGRDLGRSIARRLTGKKVLWAAYDDACVYPHMAKDVGDLTDDEIRQCLRNSVTNLQYFHWSPEPPLH